MQRDENVKFYVSAVPLFFIPYGMHFRMLTHLYSVTGAPVCRYPWLSRQPLRGEFGKLSTMPRTDRQLSESEDISVLFRIFAFMIKYYSIIPRLCQEF